jgi:hypothetical protein
VIVPPAGTTTVPDVCPVAVPLTEIPVTVPPITLTCTGYPFGLN